MAQAAAQLAPRPEIDRPVPPPKPVKPPVQKTPPKVVEGPWVEDKVEVSYLDISVEGSPPLTRLKEDGIRRPLDWRWWRAMHYRAKRKRLPSRHGDNYLKQASRFQLRLSKCTTENQALKVEREMVPMYQAFETHCHDDELWRATLEAYILARATVESITRKMGFERGTVETYKQVFFDVTDRLEATNYIILECLRGSIHEESWQQNVGAWVRYFGYVGGPAVVDELVCGFPANLKRPVTPEEIAEFFRNDAKRTVRRMASLAVRMFPIDDPKKVAKLFKWVARMEKKEAKFRAENAALMGIEANVGVMVKLMREVFDGVPELTPVPAAVVS